MENCSHEFTQWASIWRNAGYQWFKGRHCAKCGTWGVVALPPTPLLAFAKEANLN